MIETKPTRFIPAAWLLGAATVILGAFALPTPAKGASGNYLIAANDLLEIEVFQEKDLSVKARVAKDGKINLPLIGLVGVGGISSKSAAERIKSLYADGYLVSPQVSVRVSEFAKRRFTVLGQVKKPGSYAFPDNESITLLQAIGMAEGFTRIANRKKVTIKRRVGGREVIMRIDAKRLASEGSSRPVEILVGDVITVAESMF